MRRQSIIALSSTEAEYIAATDACRELLWLRGIISELTGKTIKDKTPLLCDNQSAIALAKSGLYSPHTKHIDIRFHFLREAVDNSVITMEYINTNEMLADLFTKPLALNKLDYFKHEGGLRSV